MPDQTRPLSTLGPQPTIGAARVGDRYLPPPLTLQQLMTSKNPIQDVLENLLGPSRPPSVYSQDPIGEKAWAIGAGQMPIMAGTTEGVGTAKVSTLGRGLFSRVEDVASQFPAKGIHPNKALSLLKSGASAEELAYRNVPTFLASKGNNLVTPQEMASHLAEHPAPMPKVKTLRGSPMSQNLERRAQEFLGRQPNTADDYVRVSQQLEGEAQQFQRRHNDEMARRYFDLSDEASRLAEDIDTHTGSTAGTPQYRQYQLPGGENYRETLLTLPDTKAVKLDARRQEIEALGQSATEAQKQEWASIMNQLKPDNRDVEGISRFAGRPEFRGSHFSDTPNILAHTRSNERTLPTGERGHFIEEVQSDWHQKGKAEGYAGQPVNTSGWTRVGGTGEQWTIQSPEGKRYTEFGGSLDEVVAKAAGRHAVPDAPFKDNWPDLALKQHVLDAAADPHANWIGFTSGETQAARYDLSKQIDQLQWVDYPAAGKDHGILVAWKDGNRVIHEKIPRGKLADYIGKEPAEKLLSQPSDPRAGGSRELSGVDLQVGGKGMQTFYDQILPKRMEKIVKPFGGTVERAPLSGRTTKQIDAEMDAIVNELRSKQGVSYAPSDADWARYPDLSQRHDVLSAERTRASQSRLNADASAWIVRLTPEMKAKILKAGLPLMAIPLAVSHARTKTRPLSELAGQQ